MTFLTREELHELSLPSERYDEIRSAVADLIEDWSSNVYPFSIWSLLRKMCISTVPYSALQDNTRALLEREYPDALTIFPPDFNPRRTTIYYNDRNRDRDRIRFTLAHELGHLVLMHSDSSNEAHEHEADIFANYLLAPAPLITEFSRIDYEVVSADFAVSYSCAVSACDRAAKRRHFGPSKNTEYEQRILNTCILKKGGGQLAPV